METQRQKVFVAVLSVLSNTTLIILKLIVGLIIGSVSVISEAIHSGVDLLASIIALLAVKKSNQPADQDHSYGHGKYENLSGATEALLIFVAAAWIIYEAIHKLINPKPIEAVGWGVGVMFFSSVVNIFVSRLLFKVGKKTDSIALQADGWHLLTDVYTSAGVMVGLLILFFGEWFMPQLYWHWIDPVAALGVALLIIKAAYQLTVKSISDLLDVSLPPEEEILVINKIKEMYPQVMGFHNFCSRKSGATRFVEFHLMLKATISVQSSHAVSDKIEREIKSLFNDSKVMVHIEPCDDSCKNKCLTYCFVKYPPV
ncbi:MAG: cation diffusion facilitator family transporter [Pseudomonadota bacterium]